MTLISSLAYVVTIVLYRINTFLYRIEVPYDKKIKYDFCEIPFVLSRREHSTAFYKKLNGFKSTFIHISSHFADC